MPVSGCRAECILSAKADYSLHCRYLLAKINQIFRCLVMWRRSFKENCYTLPDRTTTNVFTASNACYSLRWWSIIQIQKSIDVQLFEDTCTNLRAKNFGTDLFRNLPRKGCCWRNRRHRKKNGVQHNEIRQRASTQRRRLLSSGEREEHKLSAQC